MEEILGKLNRNGTTLHSDRSKSLRMNGPPKALYSSSPTKGKGFEDLGSDFSQSRNRIGDRRGGTQTLKEKRHNPGRLEDETLSSGSDELDFLSEHSSHSRSGRTKDKSSGSKYGKREETQGVVIDGEIHRYHPDYKPKKLPSFKKMKKPADTGSSQIPTTPQESTVLVDGEEFVFKKSPSEQREISLSRTTQLTKPSRLSKPFKVPSPAHTSTKSQIVSSLSQISPKTSGTSKASISKTMTYGRNEGQNERRRPRRELSPVGRKVSAPRSTSIILIPDNDEEQTPRPQRPKPRPAHRGTRTKQETRSLPSVISIVDDEGSSREKAAHCPLDTLSPIKKGNSSEAKGKAKADPFSRLSPLSSPAINLLKPVSSANTTNFPTLSPLSSPAHAPQSSSQSNSHLGAQKRAKVKVKLSGRRIVSSSEQDDSSEDDMSATRIIARPFPMATHVLQSIGHSPGKRASEESGEDHDHKPRKRIKGHDELLQELLHSDDMSDVDDNDLRFIDPNVDPSTLCPWCDEPLPPVPSPYLDSLMQAARRRSSPDSRPTNPLGLRASLTVYIGVCQRHSFESVQVPQAQKKGWPMRIEWSRVAERVTLLNAQLRRIVDDVDEEFLPGSFRQDPEENLEDGEEDHALQQQSPRKGSIFWRDVVKNVKRQGSRQTAGVRGQFSSFSKTQPGYYGELGYVIIHQTIYDLFPPTSFDADSTLPLTPTEFIQLILVPEAAVALIMQDMRQSRKDSIRTLRESAEYGVAMFPDDHSEGGATAVQVGENIVRERARARRKAIEDEEREEDELWEAVDRPSKPKNKGKAKATTVIELSDSEESGRSTRRRGAGRRCKDPPVSGTGDDADVIMVSDSADSTASKTRKPRKPKAPRTDRSSKSRSTRPRSTVSDADVDLCESSDTADSDAQSGPPPTPRPRRKGPRSSEKENMKVNDRDSDIHEVSSQPSSSQLAPPEVKRDRHGNPRLVHSEVDADEEQTPKVHKSLNRTSSNAAVVNGESPGSFFPLVTARKKGSSTTPFIEKDLKQTEHSASSWAYNLRDGASNDGDESHLDSDASCGTNPSRRTRSSKRRTVQPAEDI